MQFTYGITYVRTGNTAKIYVYYNNSCNVLQVGPCRFASGQTRDDMMVK